MDAPEETSPDVVNGDEFATTDLGVYRRAPADLGEEPKPSRRKLKLIVISIFGFVMFVFFLIQKLPEARIQNFIIAHARIMAQEQGLAFSAEKVRLGTLLGLALKFENVELKALEDDRKTLKIAYLRVRPHLTSLPFKTKKATISADLLGGSIGGVVGGGPTSLVTDLDVDSLNLAATTLLKKFLPLDVTGGTIDGQVKLDLDLAEPAKSDGRVDVRIEKLAAPAQALYGFNLPGLKINKATIDLEIKKGQINIRTFEVGKDPKTDDLVAKITGNGTLDRPFERSRITAKASFQLSPTVAQSFPLLDALLGQARQPDGSYAYRLNGPLMGLETAPGQ